MPFDVQVFYQALFSPALMQGAMVTIALSLLVQFVSLLLAIPAAAGLMSPSRPLRYSLNLYLWLFRGAPMLLVLLLVWNGFPQLFPILRSDWFSPFLAAALAMTLVEVAYNAEIVRASLLSIQKGQAEAAAALGLHRGQTFFLVILPQAFRVAIPPLMNEFLGLLKATSLAFTISLRELMTVTQISISATFRFTEWYAAALIYYMVMITVLTLLQVRVERRLAQAYGRASPEKSKPVTVRPALASPINTH